MADFGAINILARAARTNSTIEPPDNIQNGQLIAILFEIAANTAAPTPTKPTGFQDAPGDFPSTNTDGSFVSNVYLWWKIANNELGNYLVIHDNAITSAVIFTVTGASQSNPFSVTPTIGEGSDTGTTATAPGLNGVAKDSLVCCWINAWDLGAISAPGGTTPAFITRYDPTDAVLHLYTGVMPSTGNTGDKTLTIPVSGSPWSTGLFAIASEQPPSAGGFPLLDWVL